jgi:hypothetical protein
MISRKPGKMLQKNILPGKNNKIIETMLNGYEVIINVTGYGFRSKKE